MSWFILFSNNRVYFILVKGFRRSVDSIGYGSTDKSVILLKILCDEEVPRIEIKLATNGYSKRTKNSEFKLRKKTEFDNESVINNLLVEPSYPSNALVLKQNDYTRSEATINTNGSPLNELHNSLLTSGGDPSTIPYGHSTYTIERTPNIDSTALVNNMSMLSNEETYGIKTVTIKSFCTQHNNLTHNSSTKEITTSPGVTNADLLLENVDKYRKIYSHSFYQRDKSEPELARDVSQVTSEFLLNFLPLVVPHTLPYPVNLMSVSNSSSNQNFEANTEQHKNFLKSSPILNKIITDSRINAKARLLYSHNELNNSYEINHHKRLNITSEGDITNDFEDLMSDNTTTTDAYKITFLRKELKETSMPFSSPNMSIAKVTPVETNVHKRKNWSFSNSDEVKFNVILTTPVPGVKKEVNKGFSTGNNSSFLSQKHKIVTVENVAGISTIQRQSKNFNMFNNKIRATRVPSFIVGNPLTTNDMRTSWLKYKSKENKTFRKLRKHFFGTAAVKPVITFTYINTTTISYSSSAEYSLETDIYPIL